MRIRNSALVTAPAQSLSKLGIGLSFSLPRFFFALAHHEVLHFYSLFSFNFFVLFLSAQRGCPKLNEDILNSHLPSHVSNSCPHIFDAFFFVYEIVFFFFLNSIIMLIIGLIYWVSI